MSPLSVWSASQSNGDIESVDPENPNIIFDDRQLLEGYAKKFANFSKEDLTQMIQDDSVTSYKMAAAVRVFEQKFSQDIVMPEKKDVEKWLFRRLNHNSSPFVEIEVAYTLCRMDRYHYFESLVPVLIHRLNHYSAAVNDIAYERLNSIIECGNNRPREARIVFESLRAMFFLTRKNLAETPEMTPKIKNKIKILRWSIKVLGIEELQRLPSEVIHLL
ncbi:MAG: hypothetical protein HQL23_08955 [Candidatus Omnitrophica bacterium]|nr:hypothetical protein [Candidatus Omnitrophota bacterium]